MKKNSDTVSKIVLCADDDPDDKQFICEAITNIDPAIKIVHALNGIEAMEALNTLIRRQTIPCLLIVDINMPLLGGRELVKKLKENPDHAGIPIAVFTTSRNPLDVQYFATFDITVFVKPTTLKKIQETIEHMLTLCVN
jgi:CheY-like chemotaxis protein